MYIIDDRERRANPRAHPGQAECRFPGRGGAIDFRRLGILSWVVAASWVVAVLMLYGLYVVGLAAMTAMGAA